MPKKTLKTLSSMPFKKTSPFRATVMKGCCRCEKVPL